MLDFGVNLLLGLSKSVEIAFAVALECFGYIGLERFEGFCGRTKLYILPTSTKL